MASIASCARHGTKRCLGSRACPPSSPHREDPRCEPRPSGTQPNHRQPPQSRAPPHPAIVHHDQGEPAARRLTTPTPSEMPDRSVAHAARLPPARIIELELAQAPPPFNLEPVSVLRGGRIQNGGEHGLAPVERPPVRFAIRLWRVCLAECRRLAGRWTVAIDVDRKGFRQPETPLRRIIDVSIRGAPTRSTGSRRVQRGGHRACSAIRNGTRTYALTWSFTALGAGGRGFKSPLPDQVMSQIAIRAQLSRNREVISSGRP